MKGIYLASFKAYHPNYDIDYNDIQKTSEYINIVFDMMNVDLTNYDYIIATPPCNYWSRANYRRETSHYSQKTKHLLPGILEKLCNQDKPFIVENVRNYNLMKQNGLYDFKCYIYEIGRHTYWTNIMINPYDLILKQNYSSGIQNKSKSQRQGGNEVHEVIEYWLENVITKIWATPKGEIK